MVKKAAIALLLYACVGLWLARSQEVMPSGITCCDEDKVRLAMEEEALARVAARHGLDLPAGRRGGDYLSEQAYEKVRALLPDRGRDSCLAVLRACLRRPDAEDGIAEFQSLIANFILGMTLEIGHTLQDEYDRLLVSQEKIERLLAELEKPPLAGEGDLARALFRADVGERELRRIRSLEARWREAKPGATAFDEFNALKRSVSGRRPDPDQRPVFDLAEAYRERFPFADEFLAAYRRLAGAYRESARRVNEMLAARGD